MKENRAFNVRVFLLTKKTKVVIALLIVTLCSTLFRVMSNRGLRGTSKAKRSGVYSVTGGLDHSEYQDNSKAGSSNARPHEDDDVCFHYDGILLISYANKSGFATVFFLYVLNQLLYAEKHNLLPWIHLDSATNAHVYDDEEHNHAENPLSLGVNVLNGLRWMTFQDSENNQFYKYPGKPVLDYKAPGSETSSITINGTGIWSSYFDPPSKLDPLRHLAHPETSTSSCHQKPIFQLTLQQIEPSLMVYAPYTVQPWRRKSTPPSLANWKVPYQDWFEPMRQAAHGVIHRHYHPTEEMVTLAHKANPVVEAEEACLAMHIRRADKADQRQPIPVETFLPYAEAYLQASIWVGTTIVIYIATDSNEVISEIQDTWPTKISSYVRYQQSSMEEPVLRSSDKNTVFKMNQEHHRMNTEIFVDILAMAKCEFMVHGMSAVSEAVHYMNPLLHRQSVNLEEDLDEATYLRTTKATMTHSDFGKLVRNRLNDKRRETEAERAKMDHST